MKMKNRVLAALALTLLIINMAPVKRAEAETIVLSPSAFQIKESLRESLSGVYPFEDYFRYAICSENSDSGVLRYYLFDVLPDLIVDNNGNLRLKSTSEYTGQMILTLVVSDNIIVNYGMSNLSGGILCFETSDDRLIGSSFNIGVSDYTYTYFVFGNDLESAGYVSELPYVSAFTKYSSGGRSSFDGTKTTYWNCSIKVEGTMAEEAAQKSFIVEGKYLIPTRAYFDMCRKKDEEPNYLEWIDMYYKTVILKKANYDEYYTIIDYRDEVEYNESLICLETSNYIMEMKKSGALDDIYDTNVLNVETYVYKPFLNKIKSFITPLEARVTVKCVLDMNVCYGKTYVTQMYHHIASDLPDINVIVENYYDLKDSEEVVKSSMQGALQVQTSEYYQNLLADMQQKLNDAEIKVSTLEQSLAVEDGGNLFGTFASVANGLAGLSGSFRGIAVAVGNVFAFFPEEITGLLFAGIVAMIVIAVYKALRG